MKLSHYSTICIIPPDNIWPSINNIRVQLKDKGLYRWPPHINLIYPSFEEDNLKNIIPELSLSLSGIKPFDITLNEFGVFGGSKKGVLYLKPNECDDDNMINLYNTIENIISKHCDEKKNKKTKPKLFVPHLTVCHTTSSSEAWSLTEQFQPFQPIKFTIDRVYCLSRPINDPDNVGQFSIQYTLLLGQSIIPDFENHKYFELMPKVKEEWINEAEIDYKNKNKNKKNDIKLINSEISSEKNEQKTNNNDDCNIFTFFKSLFHIDELWLKE